MILILGTPGAGKTTQTRLLAEYLNCPWFSMGELIRADVKGNERRDMLAGKIISDETTIKIVDKALNKVSGDGECVFEGNPRSVPQATWWLNQVKAGRFSIKGVVHLIADPEVAGKRMIQRGRLDDHNDNVVEKRFSEYKRSIAPTLAFLTSNGVAIHEINGNNSIEQVEQDIHKALGI
ncbi:MAG TPA: nucleoside monophosphate kinase [Candidatus Binatia bacterium]|nr:nucleoside monophosphate kinase [Candidatus Binatia bacterium]